MKYRYTWLGIVAALSCVTLADADVQVGDVLISEYNQATVKHFDDSGVYQGIFADGLPANTHDVAFSPDGMYAFVATGLSDTGGVAMFDACDGTFLEYAINATEYPGNAIDLAFGPSGDLYVTFVDASQSFDTTVVKYDLGAGVHEALFSGPVKGWGLGVGPNGNVFVSEYENNQILEYEYDGSDWNQAHVISDAFLEHCQGIAFGFDGALYATSERTADAEVVKFTFDGVGSMWSKAGELDSDLLGQPVDLAFGSDGALYVLSHTSNNIARFDLTDDTSTEFINNNLNGGYGIAFRSGDCNGNDVPDWIDIARGEAEDCNGNYIPDECDLDGDIDGDGDVDLSDLAILLANFGQQVYQCLN